MAFPKCPTTSAHKNPAFFMCVFSQNVFPLQPPKSSMETEGQSCHVAFYTEHTAAEDLEGWWGCEATPPRQQAAVARGTLLVPAGPHFL